MDESSLHLFFGFSDRTTTHALDLISGHLCRCTHGVNRRMDNGCWKFATKDDIWVSEMSLYSICVVNWLANVAMMININSKIIINNVFKIIQPTNQITNRSHTYEIVSRYYMSFVWEKDKLTKANKSTIVKKKLQSHNTSSHK